jgi:hypothetical protein
LLVSLGTATPQHKPLSAVANSLPCASQLEHDRSRTLIRCHWR